MNNDVICVIAIAVLMAASLAVGLIGRKRANSSQAFSGATKMFGPVLIAFSTLSAMLSGFALVALPGAMYAGNMGASFWLLSTCGFALSYFVLGKRVRAMAEIGNVSTLGDIIDLRYHSRAIKFFCSFVLLIGSVAYLSAQVTAITSMFSYLFGWQPIYSAILCIGVVVIYVAVSGEVGGIMTQAFQGLIILIASLVIVGIFFFNIGGFGRVLDVVAEAGTVSGNGVEKIFGPDLVGAYGTVGKGAVLAAFFIPIIGTLGQPMTLTRMYALKSPRDLPKMSAYVSVMHIFTNLTTIAIGFAALYLVGSGLIEPLLRNDYATWAVGQYFGLAAQIIVYTAVVAAIISSASMYLMNSANFISKDILSSFGLRFRDKMQLKITKLFVAVIGVFAIVFSVVSEQGAALLATFGWGTLMSAIFPVFVTGLLWKGANTKGVLAGTVVSFTGNIVCFILVIFKFQFPGNLPWYVIVISAAVVVTIVVSLLTYDKEKDRLPDKIQAVINL